MTDDAGAGPGPRGNGEAERDATDADDEGWRFALDEVGPEAEESAPEIEPESVDVENALFVVAGVLGTLLLVFSVAL